MDTKTVIGAVAVAALTLVTVLLRVPDRGTEALKEQLVLTQQQQLATERALTRLASHVAAPGSSPATPLPNATVCEPHVSREPIATPCSDDTWYLEQLVRAVGPDAMGARQFVFVDVGFNKGWAFHAAASLFGYGVQPMMPAMAAFCAKQQVRCADQATLCGSCLSCLDHVTPVEPDLRPPSLRLVGFDADAGHVAFSQRQFGGVTGLNVTVRHALLGSKGAQVMHRDFSHVVFGVETGGADQPSNGGEAGTGQVDKLARRVRVPVRTLHAELRALGVDRVDVLLTDTEGYDFLVADGAGPLLAAGRVGLYVWEIHRSPAGHQLGARIAELDRWGYECFLPTYRPPGWKGKSFEARYTIRRRLVPISGGCLPPGLRDLAGWHNVVCANRRLPGLVAALRTGARLR